MNDTLEMPIAYKVMVEPTNRAPVSVHIADVHWRSTVPEYRKEPGPFHKVIAKKLQTVFDYSITNGVTPLPIFVSGDLFDGTRDFMQYYTMSTFLHGQHWNRSPLRCVRGQHDMYHHNPLDPATAFNALVREGLICCFSSIQTEIVGQGNICYYGCGWGEELPVPVSRDDTNVLILHKTLWHKTPVYPGQTEGNVTMESVRLAELGYSIVFSGDNHKAFDATSNGVRFYNLGAFTRNSIDLAVKRPRFCVLFSDGSVEQQLVGEEDVFEITRSEADKLHEGAKDEFSKALAGGFSQSDTFRGALENTIAVRKCGDVEFTPEQIALLKDVINSL